MTHFGIAKENARGTKMKMERRIGDVRERSCAHIVSWSVRLLQRATTMNMSLNFESFLFSKMSTPENWMVSICGPRHAPEHGNSRAKAPWHENERANHFDTKMSVQSSIAWRWLAQSSAFHVWKGDIDHAGGILPTQCSRVFVCHWKREDWNCIFIATGIRYSYYCHLLYLLRIRLDTAILTACHR